MTRAFALGGYGSCMDFYQGFGDRHPQTQATVPAADISSALLKWLKEPIDDFRSHPDAIVLEFQNQAALDIICSRNGDVTAGCTELGGVVQDIAHSSGRGAPD